jgi:hypothetical protein
MLSHAIYLKKERIRQVTGVKQTGTHLSLGSLEKGADPGSKGGFWPLHCVTGGGMETRQITRQELVAAALNWTAIWEMDVWYIFTDGSGTTARQLAKPSAKWPGPQRGNGSGTPFWLFPVGLTTPWEQLPFTNPPSKPKLCPSPDLDTQLPANFCLRHPTSN